jgi:uncharacterized protein
MQSSNGSSASTPQPTQGSERIVTLDILRGIALFGVLAANIWLWFSGLTFLFPAAANELRRISADSVAFFFISIFISGKAIRTFSFLFGLGFALQMMRAEAQGRHIGFVYSRRLIVLLTFGIVHAVVFWYGDILTTYALLGFGLLLFRRATQRTVLVWAALFIFAVPIASSSVPLIRSMVAPSVSLSSSATPEAAQNRQRTMLALFASAEPARIIHGNLLMLRRMYLTPQVINLIDLFGFFLLGLFAGRARVFEDPMVYRRQMRRLVLWGFTIGVAVALVQGSLRMRFGGPAAATLPWFPLAMSVTTVISATPFALAYIAAATLLLEHRRWKTVLGIFAPVGRMALTNYLAQTLICVTIYYAGGLFGSFRPTLGLLIAVIIFAAQIRFSTWWLARYRFGPMEWLWRSLTYGHMQPMRIPIPEPVHATI